MPAVYIFKSMKLSNDSSFAAKATIEHIFPFYLSHAPHCNPFHGSQSDQWTWPVPQILVLLLLRNLVFISSPSAHLQFLFTAYSCPVLKLAQGVLILKTIYLTLLLPQAISSQVNSPYLWPSFSHGSSLISHLLCHFSLLIIFNTYLLCQRSYQLIK